jgi:hypothetical protein
MNINPFKTFRVLVTRYYESIREKCTISGFQFPVTPRNEVFHLHS